MDSGFLSPIWSGRHLSQRRHVCISEAALLSSRPLVRCRQAHQAFEEPTAIRLVVSGWGRSWPHAARWVAVDTWRRALRLMRGAEQRHRHTREHGISLIPVRACWRRHSSSRRNYVSRTRSTSGTWGDVPRFSRLRSTSWFLGPRAARSPVRMLWKRNDECEGH